MIKIFKYTTEKYLFKGTKVRRPVLGKSNLIRKLTINGINIYDSLFLYKNYHILILYDYRFY